MAEIVSSLYKVSGEPCETRITSLLKVTNSSELIEIED